MPRHTQPTQRVDLSVLMPVYNESENLHRVIPEALNAIQYSKYRAEIVFLNDASTDDSLAILKEYQQEFMFSEQQDGDRHVAMDPS